MPEQLEAQQRRTALFGLDPEVAPVLGFGLSATGVLLGIRPRLAPWALSLTALAALLYRNPARTTPDAPGYMFAPADGVIATIDETYEHRFLHTDALRISIISSPWHSAINRSPVSGTVRYCEYIPGVFRSVQEPEAAENNSRVYIGLETDWGPVLLVQIAGPLARRIRTDVLPGDRVEAGDRIGSMRLGARVDMLIQRDALRLSAAPGRRMVCGETRIGHLTPL